MEEGEGGGGQEVEEGEGGGGQEVEEGEGWWSGGGGR